MSYDKKRLPENTSHRLQFAKDLKKWIFHVFFKMSLKFKIKEGYRTIIGIDLVRVTT